MKKTSALVIVFSVVLVSSYSYGAWWGLKKAHQKKGCPEVCSGADFVPSSHIMQERFYGQDYESTWDGSTWTDHQGSGDTIDVNSSIPTGVPYTGEWHYYCCEGLRLKSKDSENYTTFEYYTPITPGADTYIWLFGMFISSTHTSLPNDNTPFIISSWTDNTDATDYKWALQIRNNGGTYEVRATGGTDSTYIPITLNEWHEIEVTYASVLGTPVGGIRVDGGASMSFGNPNEVGQYWHFGPVGSEWSSGGEIDIYLGVVWIELEEAPL